jgi:hypothetical protein
MAERRGCRSAVDAAMLEKAGFGAIDADQTRAARTG